MVLASRTYAPGEVISSSPRPLAHAVCWNSKFEVCDNCLASVSDADQSYPQSKLSKCERCRLMAYCSDACKKEDWVAGHQWECPIFRKHRLTTNDSAIRDKVELSQVLKSDHHRTLLRLWLLVSHDPDLLDRRIPLALGGDRCLRDLMSHEEEFRRDAVWMAKLDLIHAVWLSWGIIQEDTDRKSGTKNLMVQLLGRIHTNSFSMTDDQVEGGGSDHSMGLYVAESIFDHSCRPTASWNFDGARITIRALTPIARGQEITIMYTNTMAPKATRRLVLEVNFHFTCHCGRCDSEPDDVMMDPVADLQTCISESENEVDAHHQVSIFSHINRLVTLHHGIVDHIESDKTSVSGLVALLKRGLAVNLEIIRCVDLVMEGSGRHAPNSSPQEWYDQGSGLAHSNVCHYIEELFSTHLEISFDPARREEDRCAARLSPKEVASMRRDLRRSLRAVEVIFGTIAEFELKDVL